MSRHGLAVFGHCLAVAVIRGDKAAAAFLHYLGHNSAYAFVNGMHRAYDRGSYRRMPHHIGVGEIHHQKIEFMRADCVHGNLRKIVGAHFGGKIVGFDLRRGEDDMLLARAYLIRAAVEEERDVALLFAFRKTELGHSLGGYVLPEQILVVDGAEGNIGKAVEIVAVEGHADVMRLYEAALALEIIVILEYEGFGDLGGAVGAEIEEYDAVVFLDRRYGPAFLHYDGGDNEFIRLAVFIRMLDGGNGIRLENAFTVHYGVKARLDAFVALIAVHAPEPALDCGDLAHAYLAAFRHDFLNITETARGRGIAPIHEAVDIDIFKPFALCKLQQSVKMPEARMDAAIGTEPQKVQGRTMLFAVFDRAHEGGVFEEFAVRYGVFDAGVILEYDPARAEVHMAYLGIAHLPRGKPDVHAGGFNESVGIARLQRADIADAVYADGVVRGLLAVAEAIENNECCDIFHRGFLYAGAPWEAPAGISFISRARRG